MIIPWRLGTTRQQFVISTADVIEVTCLLWEGTPDVLVLLDLDISKVADVPKVAENVVPKVGGLDISKSRDFLLQFISRAEKVALFPEKSRNSAEILADLLKVGKLKFHFKLARN